MNYPFFIARRYLRRSRGGFPVLTGLLAVLSVAVGVAALILVLGVMKGFDRELRAKIIGVLPPVTVRLPAGADHDEIAARLRAVPGVRALAPFSETQAIIRSHGFLAAGLVRAVDLSREDRVTGIGRYLLSEAGDSPPRNGSVAPPSLSGGLLLGEELARSLRVSAGDRLEIVTGFGLAPADFPVAGTFRTGLYHFDAGLVLLPLEESASLFPGGRRPQSFGLGLDDVYAADEVAGLVRERLGHFYEVESWVDRNQALFAALALERRAMAVILALIVLVAGFNIASSLMMTVWRKTREIGVLRSLGVTAAGIRSIFLWMGFLTGLAGVFTGLFVGLGLAWGGDRYQLIKVPGQFYGIDYLPIMVDWGAVVRVVALALVIAVLAAVFPARAAARVAPAVTLRAE